VGLFWKRNGIRSSYPTEQDPFKRVMAIYAHLHKHNPDLMRACACAALAPRELRHACLLMVHVTDAEGARRAAVGTP
jgi:hypothetical protein